MKVYLVNPPAPNGIEMVREGRCMQRKGAWTAVWSPISLAYCAAVLEKEGFIVKLTDCIAEKIDNQSLTQKIKSFKPEFVVFNTSTPSIESDLSMCGLVKKIDPRIKTAVFGIHVTALANECFEFSSDLDFVVRGEPEDTILELAKKIKTKGKFDKVTGVTWRKKNQVVKNSDRQWVNNLDDLPFPAWHLINKNNYIMPFTNQPFFLVATGRGCPYHCLFCADKAYYGQKLRLRSPESVVDELEHNQKIYGVSEFLFWTESFTINKEFSAAICDEIVSRGLEIRWVCNSRVDNVDLELLKKFKQAGCQMIGYGVESGSQKVLNQSRKGTTLEQTKRAVYLAKQAGLEVTGHCIIGLPGETKETIHQTEKFVAGLDLNFVQFYCAVPFPGSDFYKLAKEKGWIISNNWSLYEQNFSVLNYPKLSSQEVIDLRQQAYRNFYLSPKTILKTLLRLRTPKEFFNFLYMAKDFFSWIRSK